MGLLNLLTPDLEYKHGEGVIEKQQGIAGEVGIGKPLHRLARCGDILTHERKSAAKGRPALLDHPGSNWKTSLDSIQAPLLQNILLNAKANLPH
jgi:hypothetical protein